MLIESQKQPFKLLKPKPGDNKSEENETTVESESRSFYTPTKSVTIGSVQNNDTNRSRNKSILPSRGEGTVLKDAL